MSALTPRAERSVGELFEQYSGRIRRYIRGMVRDASEAEDLTQETFLRLHRKLGSLRDPDALPAWLFRIATHVCYDRFRQSSPRLSPGDGGLPDEAVTPGPDRLFEQAEMSSCVQDLVVALPAAQRRALLLHDVHGMTSPEVAHLCGTSVEAVKISLHRARQRLKSSLVEECQFSRDERDVFVCSRRERRGAGSA